MHTIATASLLIMIISGWTASQIIFTSK